MIATVVRERYHIAAHPHHDRLHHVTLSEGYLRAFFQSVEGVSVELLEHTPYMRFILAQRLDDLIGSGLRRALQGIMRDRRSGGFTVGIQSVTIRRDDYQKLATAVSHLLGSAAYNEVSGTYYERHTVADAACDNFHRRETYRPFTLHTDGTFANERTDWLLMMKFDEQHAVGGACRLLHLDDWEDLRLYSENPLGSKDFHYMLPGKRDGGVLKRKTFSHGVDGVSMCFIDKYVHPETMEQACYLKEMSDSMERSPWTTVVPLPVGDILMLNNHFWLHGRAAFQKHQSLHLELMRQRGMFSP